MEAGAPESWKRLRGALFALATEGLLVWLLIAGLMVHWTAERAPGAPLLRLRLSPLDIVPPPPAMPPQMPRKAESVITPPIRISEVTSDVATPSPVQTPLPIVAAPLPATASTSLSGDAPLAGSRNDKDGQGNAAGAAGNGFGEHRDIPLRLIKGGIGDADYPRAAARVGASGTVYLRFIVDVSGRVTDCTVTRSSGNVALDDTTCRLIRKRFRYIPSKDARGRPYADVVTGRQVWVIPQRSQLDGQRSTASVDE